MANTDNDILHIADVLVRYNCVPGQALQLVDGLMAEIRRLRETQVTPEHLRNVLAAARKHIDSVEQYRLLAAIDGLMSELTRPSYSEQVERDIGISNELV